jgi:phosphoglycerate dehydrogenase-like enzyme
VGIVGLGHIGSKVAKRLQGFETTTLYADVRDISAETETALQVQRVSMDELLERCDVVTVHVPLSRTTRGLFSTPQFRAMRNDAIFINTCRGPVQDEAALIKALQNGEIAAAGLDVTEVEPTPLDNPLLKMDNVIVTPHLAGSSQERVDRAIVFSFENARRVIGGQKPLSPVQLID